MTAGDVPVSLGGASFLMRPDWESQRQIEARTTYTIHELYQLVMVEQLKLEEAAIIVWFGCKAAGEEFDDIEAVGKRLFEARITSPQLRESLAKFLLGCLWSPEEAQKKWEAEAGPVIRPEEIV